MKRHLVTCVTIFLFSTFFASHFALANKIEIGPSSDCERKYSSMDLFQTLEVYYLINALPEMLELADADPSLVGQKVSVKAFSLQQLGRSSDDDEVEVLSEQLRYAMIHGCEGVRGEVISLDASHITLENDDGEIKIPRNTKHFANDYIFIQSLEKKPVKTEEAKP